MQNYLRAYLDNARANVETALSFGSGAVSEIPAGASMLYALATGQGVDRAVAKGEKVRSKIQYTPRTAAGKAQQQMIGRAVGPIADFIERTKTRAGNATLDATGSPGLATAVHTAPDALLSLIGARPAAAGLRQAGAMGRNALLTEMPAMGSPGAQLGMFAGRGARTADLNAMARAQTRLASGDDARAVWSEDGWMRGPDGKMRFEIDDSQSRFNSEPLAAPLNEALDHPELNSAYDLSDVAVTIDPYAPHGGSLDTRGGTPFMEVNGPVDTHRSTALHETQHAVQRKEGFARGGSMDMFYMDPAFPKFSIAEKLATTRGLDWEGLRKSEKASITDEVLRGHYQRLAGEAEARAVEKRMDYTPEQRRAVYPLDDYDVPLDELIFRGGRQ